MYIVFYNGSLRSTVRAIILKRKLVEIQWYMKQEIQNYHKTLSPLDQQICDLLATLIIAELPEATSKIWHSHPVWFLDDNPIVGYSKQKKGIRLMFWSGADFNEASLNVKGEKFKDASIFYNNIEEVQESEVTRWLLKSKEIQWDYKNIVKRKGRLERIN